MLKDIHIKNYRGIKDLKIKDFKRINLLVGDNNSGKTSVLEAVGLSINYNITGIVAFENFREKTPQITPQIRSLQEPKLWNDFEYLFYEKNFDEGFEIASTIKKPESKLEDQLRIKCILSREIEKFSTPQTFAVIDQNQINSLIAEYTENGKNLAKLGYSRDGTANEISNLRVLTKIGFITSSPIQPSLLMPMMQKVVEENGEDFFSKIAQEIDPKIKNIKTASDRIYADIGKISVPLKYMGDGLIKVISILLSIRELRNGILLIDEIENGLHWKTQRILWKAVIKAAEENNVQIIATTHSYDIIDALSKICEEENMLEEDEIRLFKIKKDSQGNNHALKYNSGMIKHVVEDEAEVR